MWWYTAPVQNKLMILIFCLQNNKHWQENGPRARASNEKMKLVFQLTAQKHFIHYNQAFIWVWLPSNMYSCLCTCLLKVYSLVYLDVFLFQTLSESGLVLSSSFVGVFIFTQTAQFIGFNHSVLSWFESKWNFYLLGSINKYEQSFLKISFKFGVKSSLLFWSFYFFSLKTLLFVFGSGKKKTKYKYKY